MNRVTYIYLYALFPAFAPMLFQLVIVQIRKRALYIQHFRQRALYIQHIRQKALCIQILIAATCSSRSAPLCGICCCVFSIDTLQICKRALCIQHTRKRATHIVQFARCASLRHLLQCFSSWGSWPREIMHGSILLERCRRLRCVVSLVRVHMYKHA